MKQKFTTTGSVRSVPSIPLLRSMISRIALFLVVFAFSSGIATAQVVTETCVQPALDIPDNGAVSVDIPIAATGFVFDVDVELNIAHTWQGDLIVDLVSPAACAVTVPLLFRAGDSDGTGAGFSANNFAAGFILDDAAAEAYDAAPTNGVGATPDPGIADVSGAWKPFGSGGISLLSDFNTCDDVGTWSFDISDNAGGDVGTVNEICLTFTTFTSLPVELASFTSQVEGKNVALSWETNSETNNAGFEVQLNENEAWNTLGFVEGNGSTTEAQSYSYLVQDLDIGTHAFRLKQVDYDGAFEYSDEIEATLETPGTHVLTTAYPNPFNPQSRFTLAVPVEQEVTVEIFSMLGQQLGVVFSGTIGANEPQLITIDGSSLLSGNYIVRVHGENFNDAFNVTLLK